MANLEPHGVRLSPDAAGSSTSVGSVGISYPLLASDVAAPEDGRTPLINILITDWEQSSPPCVIDKKTGGSSAH